MRRTVKHYLLPFLLVAASLPAASAETRYQIEQMKDNVYRFSAGHYRSVFMVTEAGIFATDPIDAEAASWLRDELAERFADAPIRYVAYSHNHIDHTRGGRELAPPQAPIISHRLAREDLLRTRADTRLPDVVFDQELSVHLGGSDVHLRYHGTNNGRGSVSMSFMPANVLYVVDWIVLGRMPYKDLKGYDIHGMINSTREVLETDFDLLIGGHAEAGTRQDVEHYLGYLEALYAAVRDGMLQGKSLDQLKQDIRLDKYKDLAMYEEWLPLNIEGVYRTLNDQSYFDMRSDISPE